MKRSGLALTLMLIVVVVLTILVGAITTHAMRSHDRLRRDMQEAQALELARAGLAWGRPGVRTLGAGAFEVHIEGGVIESTGVVGAERVTLTRSADH